MIRNLNMQERIKASETVEFMRMNWASHSTDDLKEVMDLVQYMNENDISYSMQASAIPGDGTLYTIALE